MGVLGIATIVDLYQHNNPSNVHYGIAGLTAIFAFICYAIIPATNRATDEGNKKKFNLLAIYNYNKPTMHAVYFAN